MNVTLMGPDDLGYWVLTDNDGNTYPLVARHEDHPSAAESLGWLAPEEITDQEELIDAALDWLMMNTGEDFEAPPHVAEFFERRQAEVEE